MVHKLTNRPQRVAELIKRELAVLIARELEGDLAHRVTLTDADVSRDLKNARVYFTILGGSERAAEAQRLLNHAAGFLRHELKHRIVLRSIPELRFHFDESVERGARIEQLLNQALAKDADKESG
jgi:ribosome-binding factor A